MPTSGMTRRLELQLHPGRSLGWMQLGNSLWTIVNHLRAQRTWYNAVDFKFSEKNPLSLDIILDLVHNGIKLIFEGSSQRLKSILIVNFDRLRILYQDEEACGDQEAPPSIQHVYKLFGPTYPGVYEIQKEIYTLSYPGVAFNFHIPSKYANKLSNSPSDLPLQLPDGRVPIAQSIVVHHGVEFRNVSSSSSASASVSTSVPGISRSKQWDLRTGERDVEAAVINLEKKSVLINLSKSNAEIEMIKVVIGLTTTQDLIADLGSPLRVFFKQQDKMRIYEEQQKVTNVDMPENDYFYNYFHLGLDFLMDGTRHIVKKIIVHGNVPGHFDFMRYKRCEWSLLLNSSSTRSQVKGMTSSGNKNMKQNAIVTDADDLLNNSTTGTPSPSNNNGADPTGRGSGGIRGNIKFARLQKALNKHFGKVPSPMILDRSATSSYRKHMRGGEDEHKSSEMSGNNQDEGIIASPLVHTELYGYPGLILEVMKNGSIGTLMLV